MLKKKTITKYEQGRLAGLNEAFKAISEGCSTPGGKQWAEEVFLPIIRKRIKMKPYERKREK